MFNVEHQSIAGLDMVKKVSTGLQNRDSICKENLCRGLRLDIDSLGLNLGCVCNENYTEKILKCEKILNFFTSLNI